jgi:nitronate monooxygenase
MHTRLCSLLGVEYPILNAPMAGGAGASLAAAVSEAGGFGVIGGSFRDRDGLRDEIRRARALTARPFGVGFISHTADAAELAAAALAEGIAAVAHSFADPTPFVAPAHDAGALVICQVRSVGEAENAAAAGVDIVVAQGTEAGGHTGMISTLPLVPAVVDAIEPLPVIAAGGIADGRGFAAALLLGAEGVWMGTRFVATPEFDTARAGYREAVVNAGTGDTVLTDVFDLALDYPFPPAIHGRTLRNAFTDQWHGREEELRAWDQSQRDDYVTTAFITEAQGPSFAGEAAGLVSEIEPANEVVRRVVAEADFALKERTRAVLEEV